MFTLGLDFGTNSVRALVVRCADGAEYGGRVVDYPSGAQGVLLDPNDGHLARQYPGDYPFGLEESVKGALAEAAAKPDFQASKIVGVGVDTTGSSPLPVDDKNRPLALSEPWRTNLSAQCWLWKDHTSWREAAKITELSAKIRPQFIAKCGGVYSSEWFWSKIWHCLNVAPTVFEAAASWVELADWIPSVLAGVTDPALVKRGVCAAGHKALYSDEWGGLPDKEFLSALDPRLGELRGRLYEKAHDANEPAGSLCPEWAARLGLNAGIPIAIGEFDVHYGAIGCGVREGTLVKVIGTSTCDCAVVSAEKPVADIPGICGIVKGAILPGYFGIEAGQSAVGDIFKWWVEGVCGGDAALHAQLTAEAAQQKPGQAGLLALDWNNGNRTILVDQLLSGLILGQDLYTTRADVYRALIEATAFGARAIIERIRGIRRARRPGRVQRRHRREKSAADADLCRRDRPRDARRRLEPELRAGFGDRRRRARRRASGLRGRTGGDDVPEARALRADRGEPESLRPALRALSRPHDSFGGLTKSADLSRVMKTLIEIKYAQRA